MAAIFAAIDDPKEIAAFIGSLITNIYLAWRVFRKDTTADTDAKEDREDKKDNAILLQWMRWGRQMERQKNQAQVECAQVEQRERILIAEKARLEAENGYLKQQLAERQE